MFAHAGTEVRPIPNIENMGEGDAIRALEERGFIPQFYYCFSNVEKYNIIPGTLDPKANFNYSVGREVKAGVSLGDIPLVIGLTEDEAKARLKSSNMPIDVEIGWNGSVKDGIVYDQDPKSAACLPIHSKIKIFVNRLIIIDKPQEGEEVPSRTVVRGRLSSDLKDGEYLWIAVKPEASIQNWWPQIDGNSSIEPIGGAFEGNAFLGGNKNDSFEIGIILLDDELNQKFRQWGNVSRLQGRWPPITEGYPEENLKVSKKEIEKHLIARVNVTLNI